MRRRALRSGWPLRRAPTPEDDFWECAAEHQDTDGIGVCCVFYGGTYDDHGQCWDYPGASVVEVDPEPNTPPKRPVLTRLPELSNIDGFAEQPKKPRDVLSTY